MSKVKKDTELLIEDTKEALKESIRAAEDSTREKLAELKKTAESGLLTLDQKAQFVRDQTEQRALASGQALKEGIQNLAEATTAKAADITQLVRGSAESAKARTENILNKAYEKSTDEFHDARERLDEGFKSAKDAGLGHVHSVEHKTYEAGKEAEEKSKGILDYVSEKLSSTKEYIADTAKAGLGKVEHVGDVIKEKIVGAKNEAADDFYNEAERLKSAGHQFKESGKDIAENVKESSKDVGEHVTETSKDIGQQIKTGAKQVKEAHRTEI